jgi:hypothetical protein
MKEVVSPVLTLRGGDYMNDQYCEDWICEEGLKDRFEAKTLGQRIRIHVVPRASRWTITINLLPGWMFKDAMTKGKPESLFWKFSAFLKNANETLGRPRRGKTHFWVEVLD